MPSFAAPLLRRVNWWYDHERDGRAPWIFLLLFVAAWTTFQIISYSSIDLHRDLVEAYGWSRHLSAGYLKHPPLVGWVTAAWFAVFPATDWSFHLFAMCNAALALYAVDLIARRYVAGDKRLVVFLLLLLTPFYQFHGQRFSTNQLLLSTWPIATICFLRAFESRGVAWSVAAGATAALAMLTKYYSVYLVAAFVVAALSHPARGRYLRSPAPWISAAVGLLVLSPHLYWLRAAQFATFDYAYGVHGASSMAASIHKASTYVIGAVAYVSVVCIVYVLAVRPDWRTVKDTLWPTEPARRMLVILLVGMLALPPLTAPLIGLELTSLWTMSAWFLLPIVLLAPESAVLPRPRAVEIALLVGGITVAALLATPVLAWKNHVNRDDRAYYHLASEAVLQQWRNATAQPLRIVFGLGYFSVAATFYLPDHPDSTANFELRATPWITAERIEREGWAAICIASDAACIATAERRTAGRTDARRNEVELTPRFLGHAGPAERFVIFVVPPRPAAQTRATTSQFEPRPKRSSDGSRLASIALR